MKKITVVLVLIFIVGCSSPSGTQGRVGTGRYFNRSHDELLAHVQNNQFDKARAIYKSLSTYYGGNPKFSKLLYGVERNINIFEALYQARNEQWQKAIPLARRVVNRTNPQDYERLASMQMFLAKCLIGAGREKEALEMAKSAVRTNPDDVGHYILVHDICFRLAHKEPNNNSAYVEEAFQYLAHAETIEPENPAVQKRGKGMKSTQKEAAEFSSPELSNLLPNTNPDTRLENQEEWERTLSSINEGFLSSEKQKAKRGNIESQFHVGLSYYNGEIVSQDYDQAHKWFTMAAEQGNADAQFMLAGMYLKGKGVSQDNKRAVEWYTKAANQGHSSSQAILAGICTDYVESYKWLLLVEKAGVDVSELKPVLLKDLTPTQIAEAQKRAKEFVEK